MGYRVQYGGRRRRSLSLVERPDLIVVRTKDRGPFERAGIRQESREAMKDFSPLLAYRHAGVEIWQCRPDKGARGAKALRSAAATVTARDRARATLKEEPSVHFAGRVLAQRGTGTPVLYTENFFVKFGDAVGTRRALGVIREHGLKVQEELEFAKNAWFVSAPDGTGVKVFAIAERLLKHADVELCHPELIRKRRTRAAFPKQWHLAKKTIGGTTVDAHANVVAAWALSRGANVRIAVIDDGCDTDHVEFAPKGKVVLPFDATRQKKTALHQFDDERHGTACCGVAAAAGVVGASGVAPDAALVPIRLSSALGSKAEARAFVYAVKAKADVVSCSWGPEDGDFRDAADPRHSVNTPLPDSTRLAMEYAVKEGRKGRGCVIAFAAGNGNESVDLDGYASSPLVMAVAACNDRSKKSAYSDFGEAIWCAFPSNDYPWDKHAGIWTTDRSGAEGYNPGDASLGDAAGDFTNDFGGTSSACPGVAGVAALILSVRPDLPAKAVRDVIQSACVRIDVAGGAYDANGHSKFYGAGRVDAKRAVELALALP